MSLVKEPIILNWRKIMIYFIITVVAVLSIFKVYQLVSLIANRWEEIKFAYDKPEIVRPVREDYAENVKRLEEMYTKKAQ